jgi:SAM-dependent methyltransferase
MLTLWRKLRWSVTQRGLPGTITAACQALTRRRASPAQHPFDRRYGTDTSGLIGGGALATGHPHDIYITAYAGIAPSRFEAALDLWRATITARIEDYTFIDLGCGKGRALLLASRLPFREVIGIELNPPLAAIAQRNASLWQDRGEARSRMTIQVGDATQPSLPAGPIILFFYNAFAEPLVQQLAGHLSRFPDSAPIDLLYQNAYFAGEFAGQSGCTELWRGSLPLSPEDAAADPVASPDDLTVLFRNDVMKRHFQRNE